MIFYTIERNSLINTQKKEYGDTARIIKKDVQSVVLKIQSELQKTTTFKVHFQICHHIPYAP